MIRDNKEVFFDKLVRRERGKVIGLLRKKYDYFPVTECEDIFQEGAMELWKKLQKMLDWEHENLEALLMTICRFISTHHLQKMMHFSKTEWDDRLYPEEHQVETDYGYVSQDVARKCQAERVYSEIEHFKPKDQDLMRMHLEGAKWKDIYPSVGLKSEAAAKNKKSKIVVRLRNAINGQASQDACPSFFYVCSIQECGDVFFIKTFGGFGIMLYLCTTQSKHIANAHHHHTHIQCQRPTRHLPA